MEKAWASPGAREVPHGAPGAWRAGDAPSKGVDLCQGIFSKHRQPELLLQRASDELREIEALGKELFLQATL